MRHPTKEEIDSRVYVYARPTHATVRALKGEFYYLGRRYNRKRYSRVPMRDLYVRPWIADMLRTESGKAAATSDFLALIVRAVRRDPRVGEMVAETVALAGLDAAYAVLLGV